MCEDLPVEPRVVSEVDEHLRVPGVPARRGEGDGAFGVAPSDLEIMAWMHSSRPCLLNGRHGMKTEV